MRDDVAEFAALLRQLKDRTDRSYGSLARRLTMNTSTLYRYCAGEAVPQDFAPVERLAAFCQATPEERLELHRLWLSAVAARQRMRTAGSPEAAVPTRDADTDGNTDGDVDRDRDRAGDADRDENAGRDGNAGQVADADGAPTEESRSAGQQGAEPDPDEPAPSPGRTWYRRRRLLVSSAVGCALLTIVGSTAALSGDRASGANASRSPGPRTTAPGVPRGSATTSATASPSPSPSRGSASPGPRQETPAPSATRSGPAPAEEPATGLPLTWSTDSLVWDKGCDHDYVIDKPPAQVPSPPVEQDAGAWAAAQGASHGRQTRVQISVQGRSSTAVVLKALRVRVVSRGEPAAGSAYAMGQGCGSDLTPRRFTVNLDADRPVAHPKDGADVERTIPAVHFPYRVSAEDPEVLLVAATTQAHDARWYLELDWSSQGRTGTIRIDDHGRPFRTTSIKGMPHYWYGTNDAGARAWVPYDG
ncbi:helix-turn-helix transcriptional regulator [Streptomyces sp. ALI-76-A]|uniref:helix-turn-helix domain-containing protein n=1 Tax=Streptomyces sp. ALI-76-A TaxID=3025736 RepID=UPI00256F29A7|nr:helix-turn-helix transcriptional regulator [Streptomyces sp. ALI-76-A]MDL5205896.1 helix-turn-helix transcriptional regulator [Streptomyces sp. ALI-76-A]